MTEHERPFVVVVGLEEVIAVDRRTGSPVWRYPLPHKELGTLLTRLWVEGDYVVVRHRFVSGESKFLGMRIDQVSPILTCLDYQTGAIRWQTPIQLLETEWSPDTMLVDQGQLLFTTNLRIFACSLHTGAPQWSCPLKMGRSNALGVPGIVVQGDLDTNTNT